MKKNKFCFRTCIISKQKKHKNELIRFVVNDKFIFLDLNNKLSGKGYYFQKNQEIIEKLIKNQILEKRFKVINIKEFYNQLNDLLKGEQYETKKTI